ncbi:MAG: M15 family metallopeptidase [Treponema sp.]|nr:M15 family metallopeptidase [Spirochaetales bacterium]MDY6190572.1 M15 family metallopeptidase [Treponema sp.]
MKNKLAFTLFMSFFLIFNVCAKQQNKSEKNISDVQKNETEINPEIEKLNRVLMQLSDECKAAIPNGNPQEFLQDLQAVLQSENDFSSEDLSPFYLIDKRHTVSSDYVPKNLIPLKKNELFDIDKNNLSLRPEAYEALKKLAEAALKDGVKLTVSSTYRSYEYQKNLFDYWVSVDGLEEAERESARPGTSQHQLGLALDFAPVDDAFDKTPAGKWVYENASKYGWSLSFPQGYEHVTGYRWECWHFRYIGKPAVDFQKKWFSNIQQFMIEFLDLWKSE